MLSPTKASTFLACKLKYFHTYLNPEAKIFVRPKNYYSFGLSLHKVLERYHDPADVQVADTTSVTAALKEEFVTAGYSSQDEIDQALSHGTELLQKYVAKQETRTDGARTLLIEKMLKYGFPQFDLIGRLDRVDELPNGQLRIADYKSGRESVTEQDIQEDLAMSIYQLLLKKAYPDRTVSAEIIALKTGVTAEYSMTPEEHLRLESDLIELFTMIQTTSWSELKPVRIPLCENCDFNQLCFNS